MSHSESINLIPKGRIPTCLFIGLNIFHMTTEDCSTHPFTSCSLIIWGVTLEHVVHSGSSQFYSLVSPVKESQVADADKDLPLHEILEICC